MSTKRPLHLILKAKNNSLYRHRALIEKEIQKLARHFQLQIYALAVNHDHTHLALLFPSRATYVKFIRAYTPRTNWYAHLH